MISLPPTIPTVPDSADAEASAERETALSERLLSVGLSVVVHVFLMLVCAVYVAGPSEQPELIETVEAVFSEPPPPIEPLIVADLTVFERLNNTEEQDVSKLMANPRQLANASAEPPAVPLPRFASRGFLPTDSPLAGSGFGGEELAGLGEASGAGELAGNGAEEKETGEGEIGFFGTKAKGKSFVFIVDCSGSMKTPVNLTSYVPRDLDGGGGGKPFVTRFARAMTELDASLDQLSGEQTFYVIFYNHQTYPLFFPRNAQALVPASAEILQLARGWIHQVEPGGGTDPRGALQLALALRPDVIFLLTDGEIPAASRVIAKKSNKSRTRIHTIAFGIQNHHDILKGIAADHRGRFRYVP